jgi:serine/threonine-protein kinase
MATSAPDSPATPLASPSRGDLIDGKYRPDRVLGQGAMGSVVAAHHMLLGLDVAVKVLSSELLRYELAVERFLREAHVVARLKSEHVVRVMDVGTLPGGEPYIVMDLLEGEDLDRMLQRTGPFPVARTVDYALQALEALAHAHAAGVVHRDLKPANLFSTTAPDGREVIKVLDFGVAKLTEAAAVARGSTTPAALTGEHAAVGSPGFMSPEQVRCSRDIDERADIWGMGALLYEVLTGQPAFDGRSIGEIFGAILHTEPKPLRSLRPELPRKLEAAVMRCLRRPPGKRFQSVAQLAAAIAPFGSGAHHEYPARIARTLARSMRATIPGGPVSSISMRRSTPEQLSLRRPPRATDVSSRETLLDAANTRGLPAQSRRPRTWASYGAAATLAALVSVATLVRGSPRSSAQSSAAATVIEATDPSNLAVALSPEPPPTQIDDSSSDPASSASEVAALASSPARTVKRAPPSPSGIASVRSKRGPGELPSVLDSPE